VGTFLRQPYTQYTVRVITCDIPRIARKAGAAVVEVNPEETPLTASVTDIHIPGAASEVLRTLVGILRVPGGPPPEH